MKKIIFAVALALGLSACTVVAPDPGEEAVLVQKPIFFGHGGVVDEPIKTGRSYAAFSTDKIYVDVKPVEYRVSFDDIMTSNGVPMHFDASLVLQVTDSVLMVKKYGVQPTSDQDPRPVWYTANVYNVYRDLVRNAVRKHHMNDVAINTAAISEIDHEINTKLAAYLKQVGLPAKLVRTTVGKANPPASVKDQRVKTAQEQQRSETERAGQKAEIDRKQNEIARADADNAYRTSMNLSPEQFVELERIKAIKDSCEDTKCTLIIGGQALYTAGK